MDFIMMSYYCNFQIYYLFEKVRYGKENCVYSWVFGVYIVFVQLYTLWFELLECLYILGQMIRVMIKDIGRKKRV